MSDTLALIKDLKKLLVIDKNQLDEELVHQSDLLFRISDACIKAIDIRDALKNELAVVEAQEDQRIRRDFERIEEKVTEGAVKALVMTSKKRMVVYDEFADARTKAARLMALQKAFEERGSALKDLCKLYTSNYFQENSVRSDVRTDKIIYHRNRRKMAEARAQGRESVPKNER